MGNAGNIDIQASSIEISGVRAKNEIPSLISSQTDNKGDGGKIKIDTDRLTISDSASISVRATGSTSSPGNLVVNADSIELKNGASAIAETAFDSGGNIKLNVRDTLNLSDNSLISAKATDNANGGNVEINAKFIVATPEGNSDILASAVRGNGGKIDITTQGIFGLSEGKSQPSNSTNDLDASSKFGLSGTVTLFVPESNSQRSVLDSPAEVFDIDSLFKNNFCQLSQNSKYIITGKGGIPLVSSGTQSDSSVWTDWRTIESVPDKTRSSLSDKRENRQQQDYSMMEKTHPQISPIQGWVVDRQGKVILTANPLVVTPHALPSSSPNCHNSQGS